MPYGVAGKKGLESRKTAAPARKLAGQTGMFRLARVGTRRILIFLPNNRGKFGALLLLLLMALDLSTASVCEAKSFPGGARWQ